MRLKICAVFSNITSSSCKHHSEKWHSKSPMLAIKNKCMKIGVFMLLAHQEKKNLMKHIIFWFHFVSRYSYLLLSSIYLHLDSINCNITQSHTYTLSKRLTGLSMQKMFTKWKQKLQQDVMNPCVVFFSYIYTYTVSKLNIDVYTPYKSHIFVPCNLGILMALC